MPADRAGSIVFLQGVLGNSDKGIGRLDKGGPGRTDVVGAGGGSGTGGKWGNGLGGRKWMRKKAPLRTALETLLKNSGYTYKVDGGVYSVVPKEVETPAVLSPAFGVADMSRWVAGGMPPSRMAT